jgi:hypothetical protein
MGASNPLDPTLCPYSRGLFWISKLCSSFKKPQINLIRIKVVQWDWKAELDPLLFKLTGHGPWIDPILVKIRVYKRLFIFLFFIFG